MERKFVRVEGMNHDKAETFGGYVGAATAAVAILLNANPAPCKNKLLNEFKNAKPPIIITRNTPRIFGAAAIVCS